MIEYRRYSADMASVPLAADFFQGWLDPPDRAIHRKILENSFRAIVAIDTESNEIIGFINAISDGVLSCYIPLLEVVPRFRHRGIGTHLVEAMMEEIHDFYMVDLCCDDNLRGFYERLDFTQTTGMIHRNYAYQSGRLHTADE